MRISLLISLRLLWQLVAATPPRVNYVEDDAGNFSPEGRWQAGGDGAVFEIRPRAGHNGVFDLVLLSSDDMSLSPGVKMGAMTSTGTPYSYDASMLARPGDKTFAKVYRFIFKFEPDFCSFSMTPYHRGKRVNLLRWVPYLFRVSISETDTRPKNVDEAFRLSGNYSSYPVIL